MSEQGRRARLAWIVVAGVGIVCATILAGLGQLSGEWIAAVTALAGGAAAHGALAARKDVGP